MSAEGEGISVGESVSEESSVRVSVPDTLRPLPGTRVREMLSETVAVPVRPRVAPVRESEWEDSSDRVTVTVWLTVLEPERVRVGTSVSVKLRVAEVILESVCRDCVSVFVRVLPAVADKVLVSPKAVPLDDMVWLRRGTVMEHVTVTDAEWVMDVCQESVWDGGCLDAELVSKRVALGVAVLDGVSTTVSVAWSVDDSENDGVGLIDDVAGPD